MSRLFLKSFWLIVLLSATAFLLADDTPADKYNDSGTVLSATSKQGHFYQIESDNRIYLMLCQTVKRFRFGAPQCQLEGKPIAAGDNVHFRVAGDWAYMPPVSGGMEQKLRIITTELKVIPPLPPALATNDQSATAANESGIVIGTGIHVEGQQGSSWSTSRGATAPTTASGTTPVIATAPVTAIPVTGGAPVVVMPTGPTTGGVVTGVPVTGGPPNCGNPDGTRDGNSDRRSACRRQHHGGRWSATVGPYSTGPDCQQDLSTGVLGEAVRGGKEGDRTRRHTVISHRQKVGLPVLWRAREGAEVQNPERDREQHSAEYNAHEKVTEAATSLGGAAPGPQTAGPCPMGWSASALRLLKDWNDRLQPLRVTCLTN